MKTMMPLLLLSLIFHPTWAEDPPSQSMSYETSDLTLTIFYDSPWNPNDRANENLYIVDLDIISTPGLSLTSGTLARGFRYAELEIFDYQDISLMHLPGQHNFPNTLAIGDEIILLYSTNRDQHSKKLELVIAEGPQIIRKGAVTVPFDSQTVGSSTIGGITEVWEEQWAWESAPFLVGEMEIQDEDNQALLSIDVGWEDYPQGEFQLLWNGIYLESYPEQVDLQLVFLPKGENTGESYQQTIAFQLPWEGPIGLNVYLGPNYQEWIGSFQFRFSEDYF